MKIMFDTHTFIWWACEPEKLSTNVIDSCENQDNDLILSVVSVWEMQIKLQLGKLKLNIPLKSLIVSQRQINNLQVLPITLEHVLTLDLLPNHHKDPFDRLLIAQASVENAHIATRDNAFSYYPVKSIW